MEIKDLLAKYDKFLFSEERRREIIKQAIFNVLKIEIEINNIKIKDGTVYLNIKPIYKNEILLKKKKIFEELKETDKNFLIIDIK